MRNGDIWGILHDIATPLTVLQHNLELLVTDEFLDSMQQKLVGHAYRALKQIEQLVDTAQNPQEFNLQTVVQECISLLGVNSPQVKIEVNIPRKYSIYGHESQFRRILLNLFVNALECECNTSGVKEIVISSYKNDKHVLVDVSDDGIGITGERMSSIFKSGYSTKLDSGIHGFGLSVVKELIEKEFGGRVEVTSYPNKGTTFRLILPSRGCK